MRKSFSFESFQNLSEIVQMKHKSRPELIRRSFENIKKTLMLLIPTDDRLKTIFKYKTKHTKIFEKMSSIRL